MTKRLSYHDEGSVLSGAQTMEIVDLSSVDHDFAVMTRGLSWGGDGAIVAIFADGTTKTIPAGALVPGVIHAIQVRRIVKAGTTATKLLGWY